MSSTFRTGLAVVIAVAVVGFFLLSSLIKPSVQPQGQVSASAPATTGDVVVQDVVVGTGATAQPGDKLTVNYTGKLQNGTVFDSSVNRAPFQFVLGSGQVIPGWEKGLVGMKVGGKRTIIIPPQMGYGANDLKDPTGKVVIPGNSTLVFDVELLGATPPAQTAPIPEGAAAQ